MGIAEFIKELSQISGWFKWSTAHTIRRFHPTKGYLQCPITAVAWQKLRQEFQTDEWEEAAAALGMDAETAKEIVLSCDHGSMGLVVEQIRNATIGKDAHANT